MSRIRSLCTRNSAPPRIGFLGAVFCCGSCHISNSFYSSFSHLCRWSCGNSFGQRRSQTPLNLLVPLARFGALGETDARPLRVVATLSHKTATSRLGTASICISMHRVAAKVATARPFFFRHSAAPKKNEKIKLFSKQTLLSKILKNHHNQVFFFFNLRILTRVFATTLLRRLSSFFFFLHEPLTAHLHGDMMRNVKNVYSKRSEKEEKWKIIKKPSSIILLFFCAMQFSCSIVSF